MYSFLKLPKLRGSKQTNRKDRESVNQQGLESTFESLFGKQEHFFFFAPGRVNLIGEHTDYNGGNVFPCAITLGTYGVAAKREDSLIRFYSDNFSEEGIITCTLDELSYKKEDKWANYPKGMVQLMKNHGLSIDSGADILLWGNLPNGAGLSSSASVELLTGVIMRALFELDVETIELVKLGQKVENDYIGVQSGIMDQFAVGMGRKDQAMLLDTHTLECEWVPVNLPEHKLVIMNTNKRRELADSKYNERRKECEEALKRIQQKKDIKSLGELTEGEFEEVERFIQDPILVKRARHAVYENGRTLKAGEALKAGNLKAFGQLMNQSHLSLRDDYEVTGIELDTLVEAAWKQTGVVGARMTGAGFGGCAIAIVENNQLDAFTTSVGQVYQKEIGYPADFYIAEISDGATAL